MSRFIYFEEFLNCFLRVYFAATALFNAASISISVEMLLNRNASKIITMSNHYGVISQVDLPTVLENIHFIYKSKGNKNSSSYSGYVSSRETEINDKNIVRLIIETFF